MTAKHTGRKANFATAKAVYKVAAPGIRKAAHKNAKGKITPRLQQKLGGKAKGTKNDPSGADNQSFYSKADGKPVKRTLANVYKVLSAATGKNWYEMYSANALWGGTPNGYHGLYAFQNSLGTGYQAPVHMYDLTAVPNLINNTVTYPDNAYYMQFSSETDSSSVVFPTLAVQKKLFLQNTVGTSVNSDSYPEASDMWVSTQIKLNLVGALTVPMRMHVYLVQFKKDYLCPDIVNALQSTAGQASTSAGASYLSEATAFYQSLVKPLVYNPILVQNSSHSKDMKILKHDTFRFDPKLSTEPAANEGGVAASWPHVKTVSYYERMNRKVNYKWNDNDLVSLAPGVADVQQDIGDTRCTVAPKNRVYMIIAAESFDTTTLDAFSNLRNASYDIMIKHKHEKVL